MTVSLSQIKSILKSPQGSYLLAQAVFTLSNYAYVIILSRYLSPVSFGRLTLFSALFMLLTIPSGALQLLLLTFIARGASLKNHRQVQLVKKYGLHLSLGLAFLLFGSYLIALPWLQQFFHLNSITPLLFLAPTILFLFISAYYKGILHGYQLFAQLGKVVVVEGLAKVGFAVLVVATNSGLLGAISSLGISLLAASVFGYGMVRKRVKHLASKIKAESNPAFKLEMRSFLARAMLTSAALLVMANMDAVLANHSLTGEEIGTYGLLTVFGRSMIMGGAIITSLILPRLAASAGTTKVGSIFRRGLALNSLFVSACIAVTLFFPTLLTHLLLGNATAPSEWLTMYTLAAGLISLVSYIVSSQVVVHEHRFTLAPLILSLAFVLASVLLPLDLAQFMNFYLSYTTALLVSSLTLYSLRYAKPHLDDAWSLFFGQLPTPKSSGSPKILVFNWRDTKHVWGGGAEVYIQELAKRWVKQGAQVTLFCSNDLLCKREEVVDGVQIIRRGGFVSVYIWALLYYCFRFRNRYDCIVDCENGIPFFSPFYSRKPVILLIHHVHQEIFREHLFPPFSWLAQFLEARVMPYLYRRAKVVTISDSTKRDIRRLGLKVSNVPIVSNGIDSHTYAPARKSTVPLVVYVGRLKAYKRLPDLLATARVLQQRLPAVRFVIAGDGEERQQLTKLVRLYNLESVVEFTGRISEKEKIELYQKAWTVMNPSSMEGWSITTIEANACGTPVVAADVPGLRDSVRHRQTGLLVNLGDIEGYAQALFSILTNTSLRTSLSTQARDWAEEFNWDKSSQRFLEVIQDHVQETKANVSSLTLGNLSRQ